MNIIPAIDILDQKVVRLNQGRYDDSTHYADDPVDIAKHFQDLGATNLHIVDLNAARDKDDTVNFGCIEKTVASVGMQVQSGGGIRDEKTLVQRFEVGIHRVIIGSLCVQQPKIFCTWMKIYGADKLVAALDVNIDEDGIAYPAVKGWTQTATTNLSSLLDSLIPHGLQHLLCTDISRDGMLSGMNTSLYKNILVQYPAIQLQASGGFSNEKELSELAEIGASGVIIGKAFFEGKIDLANILRDWQS